VYRVEQTQIFADWLANLKDLRGRIAIARRIERLQAGHLGDSKVVGENVHELRVHCGPGYRIYYTRRDFRVIILLSGDDKSSQTKDIVRAQKLAQEY
jgi:putative addiction module killer protein